MLMPARTAPPAETLRLLADPVRARIVEFLAAEELCVCHLVAELGTTQPNVSNHLRALRQGGLVEAERTGRYTYYRLRPESLAALGDHVARLADAAATPSPRRPC
jgi:ArsR family transcriptional regulator